MSPQRSTCRLANLSVNVVPAEHGKLTFPQPLPELPLASNQTLGDRERFVFNSHHELYTMGHLLTAACAHHRLTNKTNLLDAAKRAADYVYDTYKDGDAMLANCPINPSIIMGSVELYRATGDKRYLDLANIIIDNRGKRRGAIGRTRWGTPLGGTDLNQDRRPLREETEVVGHAVFFTYTKGSIRPIAGSAVRRT